MWKRSFITGVAAFVLSAWFGGQAQAGAWEFSFGFNYNKSNYGNSNYEWSRRYGSSLGYHFTEASEIEFSFQDVYNRTAINGYEDTTFHDQVYSVNWVQSLFGKNEPIQPYVKLGVGQLNRSATGSYGNGAAPPATLDSVTVILGAGTRIYLTRTFAIRAEVNSYLSGGAIRTWKDNIGAQFGISFYF